MEASSFIVDGVPLEIKELEEAYTNLVAASFAVAIDKDSSFVIQEGASLADHEEASLVSLEVASLVVHLLVASLEELLLVEHPYMEHLLVVRPLVAEASQRWC